MKPFLNFPSWETQRRTRHYCSRHHLTRPSTHRQRIRTTPCLLPISRFRLHLESNFPNFTLVILSTAESVSIPRTGCFLSSQESIGTPARTGLWLRDQKGWRTQWLMEGLTPSTNYTAYVVQDETKVSSPINFATKSRSSSTSLLQTSLTRSLQPHSHVH
jgi:hypothetical protein